MVQAWCTVEEVNSRVAGDPDAALLQEYADHATSVLFVMTGRRYNGEATVATQMQIDRRGYGDLTPWVPVRRIVSATSSRVPVTCFSADACTNAILSRVDQGLFVTLTLE